jgi:glycosidase
MKVIVGWNAQATGLDNVWLTSHKDWFRLDGQGNPLNPSNGYGLETDKVLLNFDNADLRSAMAAEMSYWVKHFGVDGFNCANVSNVPTGYWERITAEVNKASAPKLLWMADTYDAVNFVNAFSGGYNYSLFQDINMIPSGKSQNTALYQTISSAGNVATNTFKVNFTNNNIFSSTLGSDVTRLGAATKTGAVLAFTAPGIPMIYNGQETGLSAKLDLNSKNYPYKWSSGASANSFASFYAKLMNLRKNNQALGLDSTSIIAIASSSKSLAAYSRAGGANKVIVIANLSAKPIKASLTTTNLTGTYFDFDSGKAIKLAKSLKVSLPKFGYMVLSGVAAK